jgi:glycosyltransferase involved in cell wall biosynthesis
VADGPSHLPVTDRPTTAPLASVVISSFNYERFLPQAIDSALAQTWPSVEVIVVDDGSTDGSRAVIDRYGTRVRAVYKANGGQGSALNVGFAHSRGTVVVFVDSDDALLPHAVERAVEAMADPAVTKLHWNATEIDEAGLPTGRLVPGLPLARGDLRARILAEGPYGYHWPPTSANAWSRALLERILPMPEKSFRTCPDLYLAALAPLYGRVERAEEALSVWRKHVANHSWREDFATRVQEGVERDEDTIRALVEHARRLGLAADHAAWQPHAWWPQIRAAIADIASIVPEGGSFILANQEAWANGPRIAGRARRPFLERDGLYWGPPTDDAAAIGELERQRARGERYFVIAFPHLWYLDHYHGLGDWLRAHARERLRNGRVAIFEL